MARPMGAVRINRKKSLMLVFGGVIIIVVLFFIINPGAISIPSRLPVSPAAHYLSPPTLPYRKSSSFQAKRPPPVMHYNLNNVTITADPVANRETVLILTPMARFCPEYWENIMRLTYPHELITLGFILPSTKEGNTATAALQQHIGRTQGDEKYRFRSVIILRQDFEPALTSQDEGERHKVENQKARRSVMAKARNSLLFTTLGPTTSWVLWLDADIVETPPTIIQDLARYDKDMLAANCFQRYFNPETQKMAERPYDFNNWQDSIHAQELAKNMDPNEVLLEGYSEIATYRSLMAYFADEKNVVPLDGVGGTALLVKAEVHRDGAMFPAFPFYHLIETEGFAKMAKRLGRQPFGLPSYKVYHYNE